MFKAIWRRFSTFFIAGIVLFVLGLFIAVQVIVYYSQDLPDYKQLEEYSPSSITRVYAPDGTVLSELAWERRIYVEYEDIPDIVVKAFLAAEDHNFFEHSGIDIFSIMRAATQNILNIGKDRNPVGGSTITQQVIKNFLLTNERTLARKIKEAILAYRVSNAYSKEKILELYLNELFLGDHSYGILVAADNYFDKNLDELTIQEAAVLASLPKSPTYINPRSNYNRALERRNWVIGRMLNAKWITEEEANLARESKIELAPKKYNDPLYPYYSEAVRQELIEMFGQQTVYTKGMTVITNIKTDLQKIMEAEYRAYLEMRDRERGYRGPLANIPLEENWEEKFVHFKSNQLPPHSFFAIVERISENSATLLNQELEKFELKADGIAWTKRAMNALLNQGDVVTIRKTKDSLELIQVPEISGAAVSIEPYSGKVFALVGGYDFNISNFNRATQAKRQPGSAFKPFVYLAALENGYTPNTIILDTPVAISQGPGLPMWRPKNYAGDFLGPITLRTSLEKSRNLSTVRLLQSVGIDKVLDISERLGVYKNPPRNYSIALGSFETTVIDMANAYNTFASDGKMNKPSLIAAVYNDKGEQIYNGVNSKCSTCNSELIEFLSYESPKISYDISRVIDTESNFQLVSILEGVVKRGTGRKALQIGKTIAGKTGTTNDSKDVWFIGFTPEITTCVFLGYDTPKTIAKSASGSSYALPLFVNYMKRVLADVPDKPFEKPDTLRSIEVDYNTGLPVYHYNPYKKNGTDSASESIIIKEFFKSDTQSEQLFIGDDETDEYYDYGFDNQGNYDNNDSYTNRPSQRTPPYKKQDFDDLY